MRTRSVPTSVSILLPVALCASLVACEPRSAQEDHAPAPPVALEPTSQTVFGQRLLLYLEHAPVVRGERTRFLVHLSVLATGEPVRSGRVVLEIGEARLAAEAPTRDGLFVPEASLGATGAHPARLVVESDQASEILALAPMEVYASLDSARAAAGEDGAAPVDPVPFLMEQQWKAGLLLAEAGPRALVARLVVPARVVTPEGAEAVVAPPVEGRLVAPPSGRVPRTGERVEAGQVLALIEPPLSASDLAQLDALELEFQLKALDVVRAQGESEARLRFAERESERLTRLREQGLSTQQELDQAARDLALARGAAQAAEAMKKALDELTQRRGSAQGSARRLPLVAPLTGVIVSAGRAVGESLDPTQEVFRILDPTRLWIEGRVSEFDLGRIGGALSALARFPALPGRELALAAPLHVAPRVDEDSRTVLVRYALQDPGPDLCAGLLAELALATDRVQAAVVVPREAVVHEQGRRVAYVMLAGELFQKRELELGLEEDGFVEVRAGIAAGEHVATRGAHIVKLASLSPQSFGPGHQH